MKNKISLRDRMKSRLKEEKSKGSSYLDLNGKKIEFFSPKEDTYTITILPYKVTTTTHPHSVDKGDEWYTRPYNLHRNLGVDNNVSAVCLKSFGKKCLLCDEGWALYKDNKDKSLLPQQRNLYVIFVEEEADKGAQLFDGSQYGFEEKLKKALDKAEKKGQDEYLEFFDLEVGCSLEVDFEESEIGKGHKWYPATSIKFVDRSDVPDEVIEHGIELDKLLVEKTTAELESLLYGTPVESEDEEEDDLPITYEEEEEEQPKRVGRERKAPVIEEPEEEPKKEETPSGRRRRGIPKEEDDAPKCPHGHKFGKDCDKKDECTTCEDEIYDKCSEAGNE